MTFDNVPRWIFVRSSATVAPPSGVADFCKTNLTRFGATNPQSNVRKIFYVNASRPDAKDGSH
jgi:hypothetical protein